MNHTITYLKTFLDQTNASVPMPKRVAAYLTDWFAASLCLLLPMALVWMRSTADLDGLTTLNFWTFYEMAGTDTTLICAAIGLLLVIIYFVIVPWKIMPGKTLGKKLFKLTVTDLDGNVPGLKAWTIRLLVILLIEGSLLSASPWIWNMTALAAHINLTGWMGYIGLAGTIFSIALCMAAASRRTLHDYAAKTRVAATES
jgi:uncharacterized RDD family membrane protein YckC